MTRITVFLLFALLFTTEQAKADSHQTIRVEWENLSTIKSCVDSICQEHLDIGNLIETYFITQAQITEFLSNHPKEWEQFRESTFNSFVTACEQEQSDSALIQGLHYLLSGGGNDKDMVLEVLITIYGDKGDTMNTDFLLGRFDMLSEQNGGLYSERVATLRKKYDETLHPKTFSELTHGRWISIDKFPSLNKNGSYANKIRRDFEFPDFILDINSLEIYNGAMFVSAPTFACDVMKMGPKKQYWNLVPDWRQALLYSQRLLAEGRGNTLNLLFVSEKIQNPNTEMAISGFEGTRQLAANMQASIWSSRNANFGQKMAASAVTGVTTAILDGIFESMTVGSKQVESYDMQFHTTSYHTMDAIISYENVKARTNGITTHSDWVKAHTNRFVKWEESDSVVFITPEGKPIFAGGALDVNSPLLDEYRQVRKKYNWGKPQYLIPTILSVGVGTYCCVQGLIMMFDGIGDENHEWSKRNTHGILVYACAPIVIGGVCGLISDHIWKKRWNVYKKINQQSMDKMRGKALNVRLNPEVDPFDESIGMNVKIDF